MSKLDERVVMNHTAGFVIKVIVLSAILSLLVKYGGRLLPLSAPYTEHLNGLVIAIVVLPSLAIGAGLLLALKKSPQKSS